MNFLQKLGQNVKRIREENKITQARLAEIADVSISTIARLEIGQGFSTLKTIKQVANALNVEIETIFDVSVVNPSNINEENFIKELKKYTKSLQTKDFNFILAIVQAYIKNKNNFS
ncbi:MAG: helix-turn-helix domain-containing protein [Candidatus Gastranaerophilaceae bacterium]